VHLGAVERIIEEVIKTIGANGGTAVPLVAGFNYGYDLTPVEKAPINAEGIGYVAHPYPMKRKAPWEAQWTKDWGFVSEKYPVFATEVGFCAADDKKAHVPVIGDESYGDAFTSYCDKRGISYAVWCFDPHWGPTLIEDWSFKPTRQGPISRRFFRSGSRKPAASKSCGAPPPDCLSSCADCLTTMKLHAVDIAIILCYSSPSSSWALVSKRARRIWILLLGGKSLPWYLLGVSDASGHVRHQRHDGAGHLAVHVRAQEHLAAWCGRPSTRSS